MLRSGKIVSLEEEQPNTLDLFLSEKNGFFLPSLARILKGVFSDLLSENLVGILEVKLQKSGRVFWKFFSLKLIPTVPPSLSTII